MKKLIILLACLLMMPFCFSQERYPKKITIEGDTLVVITPKQLALTNGIIVERNFLKQEVVSLQSILGDKNTLLNNQEQQLQNYKIIIDNNRYEIDNLNQISAIQQSLWMQEKKKLRNKIWIFGGIGIGVGAVLGILINK